MEEFIDKRY